MNRRQFIALWACIGIGILMLLFPPWREYDQPVPYQIRRQQVPMNGGYHWIFSPRTFIARGRYGPRPLVRSINRRRLTFQYVGLAAIYVALFFSLRKPKTNPHPPKP